MFSEVSISGLSQNAFPVFQGLARSHAAAMGGNAVLKYRVNVCEFDINQTKAEVWSNMLEEASLLSTSDGES
jgi:hypothetical protein